MTMFRNYIVLTTKLDTDVIENRWEKVHRTKRKLRRTKKKTIQNYVNFFFRSTNLVGTTFVLFPFQMIQ